MNVAVADVGGSGGGCVVVQIGAWNGVVFVGVAGTF